MLFGKRKKLGIEKLNKCLKFDTPIKIRVKYYYGKEKYWLSISLGESISGYGDWGFGATHAIISPLTLIFDDDKNFMRFYYDDFYNSKESQELSRHCKDYIEKHYVEKPIIILTQDIVDKMDKALSEHYWNRLERTLKKLVDAFHFIGYVDDIKGLPIFSEDIQDEIYNIHYDIWRLHFINQFYNYRIHTHTLHGEKQFMKYSRKIINIMKKQNKKRSYKRLSSSIINIGNSLEDVAGIISKIKKDKIKWEKWVEKTQ